MSRVSSDTRISIWASCSRGPSFISLWLRISWKWVAKRILGASSRLKRYSRTPHAKPMPSAFWHWLALDCIEEAGDTSHLRSFLCQTHQSTKGFGLSPASNQMTSAASRSWTCFGSRTVSKYPVKGWVHCFITCETLSWMFDFNRILSVIPISALSAGTKLRRCYVHALYDWDQPCIPSNLCQINDKRNLFYLEMHVLSRRLLRLLVSCRHSSQSSWDRSIKAYLAGSSKIGMMILRFLLPVAPRQDMYYWEHMMKQSTLGGYVWRIVSEFCMPIKHCLPSSFDSKYIIPRHFRTN